MKGAKVAVQTVLAADSKPKASGDLCMNSISRLQTNELFFLPSISLFLQWK